MTSDSHSRGFTLVELLTALLVISLLAVMSYRGLGAVLDSREHVEREAQKWRNVTRFFARIESDLHLSAPRSVRTAAGSLPPWWGQNTRRDEPQLVFTRFAAVDGVDTARRVGYRHTETGEIELWVWPGLDLPGYTRPQRYPLLAGVAVFSVRYLYANRIWIDTWPPTRDEMLPRAVQFIVVLASGEQFTRTFALLT